MHRRYPPLVAPVSLHANARTQARTSPELQPACKHFFNINRRCHAAAATTPLRYTLHTQEELGTQLAQLQREQAVLKERCKAAEVRGGPPLAPQPSSQSWWQRCTCLAQSMGWVPHSNTAHREWRLGAAACADGADGAASRRPGRSSPSSCRAPNLPPRTKGRRNRRSQVSISPCARHSCN